MLRPAVILMGVAYELAIEGVVDTLIVKNLLTSNTADALPAKKIERIISLLASDDIELILSTPELREAAAAAYQFADHLRRRRNDGPHEADL